MQTRFEYGIASLKDFSVRGEQNSVGRRRVTAVSLGDRELIATPRFWSSLHRLYGFTDNIYRYFPPAEVLQRISEVSPRDRIRYCVESTECGERLLAVSDPKSLVVAHDQLQEVLDLYESENVSYNMGIVSSCHTPRARNGFSVAGDQFTNKYLMETPIDGFGRPATYLAMLRQICSNGAVALTPHFRSEVTLGKGDDTAQYGLMRVLDGFNNEEGYTALRQRFESAATSWTSVNESQKLYNVLVRISLKENAGLDNVGPRLHGNQDGSDPKSVSPLLRRYQELIGDLPHIYGITNIDALTIKKQRTLPAACRVYELLNFASEVATHYATSAGSRALQSYIGSLVSNEYDLEGTTDRFGDWKDFFFGNRATTETLATISRN